jgi:hypothetical protein
MRFHLTIIAIALSVAALALPRLLKPPFTPRSEGAGQAGESVPPFAPPVATVDKLQVRDRSTGTLRPRCAFRDLQAFRDAKDETDFWVVLDTFNTAAPSVGPALDAWVAAAPQSPFARLARAQYRERAAYDSRGKRVIKDTPARQLDDMAKLLEQSVADARAALQQNARLAAAYRPIIIAARTHGGFDACGEAGRAALALAPAATSCAPPP